MSYLWLGFVKVGGADDKVLINNPYMKFKLRPKLKEDLEKVKKDAKRGAAIGAGGGMLAGAINYALGDKRKGRAFKALMTAGKVGIPASIIGAGIHAAHTMGKIKQKNKMEEELRKLQDLPEFGGGREA